MVRFHWHVEGGQSAYIPPAGIRMDEQAGVCHLSCEMEIAGQNETCTALLSVPASYLRSETIQPIGILLAHGADADDWDSALMREIVSCFASAGHIVMRYHCRQKEARRQRILERALESAALSPLALATVEQWVVVGYDNGARIAAAVAAKTRIRIGGYIALSYPLLEPAPPPPKARAGVPLPEDSEGPLIKLTEALRLPMLFVCGSLDARCPPARLRDLFSRPGPTSAIDARVAIVAGVDSQLGCAAPCSATASPSKAATSAGGLCTEPIAAFLQALQRGAEGGEAAKLRDCPIPAAASLPDDMPAPEGA